MCRQDDTNNATSTFANIVQLINGLGLSELFKVTTSPREIIYRPTGQKIIFKGCNNPTAITSTKFISGELTDIYLEEASEIDSYDTFRKIDGSVRSQFGELQITMLLNGWDKDKEREYGAVLLCRDEKYYLAIIDKSNNRILENIRRYLSLFYT